MSTHTSYSTYLNSKLCCNVVCAVCNGSKNETGATGATGPQGLQGLKGDAGPQGEKGDTGPRGLQGLKGDTGPQGPQGLKGDGGQGSKGETGPQGPQGLKGETGPQGPIGATGAQGLKGETGPQGLKGETGPQGLKGETGPQGPIGATGEKGSIVSFGTVDQLTLNSNASVSNPQQITLDAKGNYAHSWSISFNSNIGVIPIFSNLIINGIYKLYVINASTSGSTNTFFISSNNNDNIIANFSGYQQIESGNVSIFEIMYYGSNIYYIKGTNGYKNIGVSNQIITNRNTTSNC
jgi:hypothetical protein